MSRFLTPIYFSFRCPFLKISKLPFTMLAVMQALTYTYFYYIDTSVLLENIPLVKFIKCLFVYIIKRTLHGGLKIWILFSRGKNNSLLTSCARSLNIVLPLENKIDIFVSPCNTLYISYLQDMIISRDTCFDHHH